MIGSPYPLTLPYPLIYMTKPTFPFPRSWLLAETSAWADDPATADRLVIAPCALQSVSNLPEARRRSVFLRLGARDESLIATLQRATDAGLGGILLEGPCDGTDIQKVDVLLSVAEAMAGRPVGAASIIALAGEHPQSVPMPGDLKARSTRLIGIGGPGHGLRAALSLPSLDAEPILQARGLTVLSAAAAGLAAIAALEPGLTETAFEAACRKDRADGFAGKLVATVTEAAIANRVFAGHSTNGR